VVYADGWNECVWVIRGWKALTHPEWERPLGLWQRCRRGENSWMPQVPVRVCKHDPLRRYRHGGHRTPGR